MATTRITPPADGLHGSITVNGRTYTCALGSSIDVPDVDAVIMDANGWTTCGPAVGATAARPTNPVRTQEFLDTTLGFIIKWNGKSWFNPISGALV